VLQHLAGRVWWYPHDPDPDNVQACVVVVTDDRGSVIVDAGNSPDVARRVRTEMERRALPEARWLVYTHHHWDHVWGAVAWPEVEIVGHSAGLPLLEAEARRPWSHEYLRAEVASNPRLGPSFRARARAMTSWEGFRVLPPHTVFDDVLVLPTGVELRHVGGRHAPDSVVVGVPDSRVLLLGDCYFPPPLHLRAEGDRADLDLVRRLIDPRYEWYVDAHSPPWQADDLEDT
jgi:glyoxylase-like metal-dependent hydrolase (beta-lactamase superfamily II)